MSLWFVIANSFCRGVNSKNVAKQCLLTNLILILIGISVCYGNKEQKIMVLSFPFHFSIRDQIQKHTFYSIYESETQFPTRILVKIKKKKEEYTYFPHAFGGREVVQDLELGENHLL